MSSDNSSGSGSGSVSVMRLTTLYQHMCKIIDYYVLKRPDQTVPYRGPLQKIIVDALDNYAEKKHDTRGKNADVNKASALVSSWSSSSKRKRVEYEPAETMLDNEFFTLLQVWQRDNNIGDSELKEIVPGMFCFALFVYV